MGVQRCQLGWMNQLCTMHNHSRPLGDLFVFQVGQDERRPIDAASMREALEGKDCHHHRHSSRKAGSRWEPSVAFGALLPSVAEEAERWIGYKGMADPLPAMNISSHDPLGAMSLAEGSAARTTCTTPPASEANSAARPAVTASSTPGFSIGTVGITFALWKRIF